MDPAAAAAGGVAMALLLLLLLVATVQVEERRGNGNHKSDRQAPLQTSPNQRGSSKCTRGAVLLCIM
jgi:hypothetical protein